MTDIERKRREAAVTHAKASMWLEGFKGSKEADALAQRFIDGEIDLAEYLTPSYEDVRRL